MSTGSLYSYVVPAGNSATFAILFSAFGTSFNLTVWSFTWGVFSSAWEVTITLAWTISVEPSGYITLTSTGFVPAVEVSGAVTYSNVVPVGKSATFAILSSAIGVVPTTTVWSFPVGVYAPAISVTITFASTISTVPSG